MTITELAKLNKRDLETEVRATVAELQSALAALLESLLSLDASSGELARCLKLERTLAWKLAKIATEPDALRAVQYVPGAAGLNIALRSMKRRGASADLAAAFERAIEKFFAIVDQYAEDRASFDMMVSACADEGQASIETVHRRAAFKGNSFTLGVQARTQFKAIFEQPAEDPTKLDIASLRGLVSFSRIRPNISWITARLRSSSEDGGAPTHERSRRQSLANLGDISGSPCSPLIPRFCSKPPPELVTEPGPYGFLDEKLVAGPLGKVGAVTCVSGDVWRSVVPRYADEGSRISRLLTHAYTPCEAIIIDKFVHEDAWGALEPECQVFSEIMSGPLYGISTYEPQRLDIAASVEYLGKGSAVIRTPHIPGYPDMARYVFDKLGWNGSRFDVYRILIPFPPIPATIAMRHEIPRCPVK